jgi:hypothetical protein
LDRGELVVVDADRVAHVRHEAVDVLASQPSVVECGAQGLDAEADRPAVGEAPERRGANARDGGDPPESVLSSHCNLSSMSPVAADLQ